MTFEEAVSYLIEDEGGYVDDPTDRGGETKYGISKATYPSLDIKNLTIDQAKGIYKNDFWNEVRAEEFNSPIRYLLFDMAVNHGQVNAVKILQRTAGFVGNDVDGVIGPKTIEAAKKVDIVKFTWQRLLFYTGIVKRSNGQLKYIDGWINRAMKVMSRAL
jgi:lysozyme family protein